jgi:hypothetical protein
MTDADLVNLLDETIDSLTEPLFECYSAGDASALNTVRQLGLHLLDRGCSIVARSGLPLAGLDAAVVATQDRAHAISAEQIEHKDELLANLQEALVARLHGMADSLGSTSVEIYRLIYLLDRYMFVSEDVGNGTEGC